MLRPVVNAAVRDVCVLAAALLMTGFCAAVKGAEGAGNQGEPELLTNLFQLRMCGDAVPLVVHPFRIVADVWAEDSAMGVLALRDSTGTEFVQLDLQGQKIQPGSKVCLEGDGCAVTLRKFGLAVFPRMVVDNDGEHWNKTESGSMFLRAGRNPIALQCFNYFGDFSLSVEFEGPTISRQSMPSSLLSSLRIDRVTSQTNYSEGLDYRCFEGTWRFLPDFRKLRPVRTGIATNFDLGARTRNEKVGLEFNGFVAIPRDGLYTFHLSSDDGSRLFVGESSLKVRVLSKNPAPTLMGNISTTALESSNHPLVTLEGIVTYSSFWRSDGELEMRVGNDDIRVEVFASGDSVPHFAPHSRVRASGIYENLVAEDGSRHSGRLLVPSWKAVQPLAVSSVEFTGFAPTASTADGGRSSLAIRPPTLTTAAEVKALSAELANQHLPVSIRGVVTAFRSKELGAAIQDSSQGVFVGLQRLAESQPVRRGELCQIEGVTDSGFFAPDIIADRIIHLGAGQMPLPSEATWNQLVDGALDTEYAEIEGVVTAIHDWSMVLLMEGGKITLDLDDFAPDALRAYQNALVRVRGCVFAKFNMGTHKLEGGSILLSGAAVQVQKAAPADLFDASQKTIGELLYYDPKAAPFRLLKVSGQVIYAQSGMYYLTDGTNGVQVTTRDSSAFRAGDLVEAVGFLRFGGPAIELKEAVIRKTGHAALPAPTKLTADNLLQAGHAGTLVQVEADLLNHWFDDSEEILAMQSGFHSFRARIAGCHKPVTLPTGGSKLELTGVYAPQGGGLSDSQVDGFDLLLSSTAGFRVLATPPWWTVKRVLILAGILAALLCAVLIWNKELHWKVQERGRQLEAEISNRHRVELRHAAEAERARIARDLHDDLGTGLTEVSLLAGAGLVESRGADGNLDRFRVIADKARALVSGLDVIVWAIDPKRNSLQSFADYLCRYATELFSASRIICRFKIPIECDAVPLTEAARHSLFLAVKEALNNVIRHSSATEVELQILTAEGRLQIVIADNGRGFNRNAIRHVNGLTNLRGRLEVLHGECHIESEAGKGTTVKFSIPVPRDAS